MGSINRTSSEDCEWVISERGYAESMLAYKWKHQFEMRDVVDLEIYEKNPDTGGTWLENQYPGVGCMRWRTWTGLPIQTSADGTRGSGCMRYSHRLLRVITFSLLHRWMISSLETLAPP